jgi:hypothetical protein
VEIEQIRAQQELCGYDILLLHHPITTMPHALATAWAKLFGEQVIPEFREAAMKA